MNPRILTAVLEAKKTVFSLRKPQKLNRKSTSDARPLPHAEGVGFRNFVRAGFFVSKIRGLRNLRRFLDDAVNGSGDACPTVGESVD
jgi:hypothetical protein